MVEPEDRRSKLVSGIIKAGAVAAALSSIIALIVTLAPDSEPPPLRIAGELRPLDVTPVASLAEHGRRPPVPEECSRLRQSIAGTPTTRTTFASYVQAQAQSTEQSRPDPGGDTDRPMDEGDGSGEATDTGPEVGTDTGPEGAETGTEETEQPEPTGEPERVTDARTKLPFNSDRQLVRALAPDTDFLQRVKTREPELMRRLIENTPGVRKAAYHPLSPDEIKRLAASIAGTVVDFKVRVQGRRDRCTLVRGTLIAFSTDEGRREAMPSVGEGNPFYFVPEADDHEFVADIFVPQLNEGQPFRLKLELIDDSGARLARAETNSF